MSFYDEVYKKISPADLHHQIYTSTTSDVHRALARQDKISYKDFLALISPEGSKFLKELSKKSRTLTIKHFGKNIHLYAPLYISNFCQNTCVYCGFNANLASDVFIRRKLTPDQIDKEGNWLSEQGFQSILLLTGEAPHIAGIDYIASAVEILRKKFTFIGLEIFPTDIEDYKKLVSSGASGLTIYQETYDEKIYPELHPSGPKKNFIRRLETPERALMAGFRRVGIGALLGLSDWRLEMAYLALHTDYLLKKFWRAEITISFPRLRGCASFFNTPHKISDEEVAQMIFAMRLWQPYSALVLSTRENPHFRDSLIGWGITLMSAASRTSPGGYTIYPEDETHSEQFEVSDRRTVEEVKSAIRARGFWPVFKDWDENFCTPTVA